MICASLYARLGAAFSRPVRMTDNSHFSPGRFRKAAAMAATLCAITFAPAAAQAQGLLNGTFEDRSGTTAVGNCTTGDAINRQAPTPWGIQSTPDYSTEKEIAFDVDVRERTTLNPPFDVSPSGGCFMGFRSLGSSSNEGIFQTITIDDADQSLVWQYDYTEYTQPGQNRCQPRVEFRVNGNDDSNGTSISLAPTVGAPGGPSREGEWVISRTDSFRPSDFGKSDGDTMDVYVGVIANGCRVTWGYVDSISIIAAPVSPSDDSTLLNGDDTAAGVTAALNLFDGDTAGSDPASLANTTIAVSSGSAVPAGLVLNPDGTVDVAPGTGPGIYSFDYDLCSVAQPNICETAMATVTIVSAQADDDDATLTLAQGASGVQDVFNLFDNDQIDGTQATTTNATISVATGSTVPAGLTLQSDGSVDVAPNTAPGTYSFDYDLCSAAHPTICKTATATVVINPDVTAEPENFAALSSSGGTTTSILASDEFQGAPATLSNVTITPGNITDASGDPATGITLDPATGIITVAAGTAGGTYSVAYEICDTTDPTVCDTAIETVTVVEVAPQNDSDTLTSAEAQSGQTAVLNLFDNDQLNSAQADATNTTISASSPVPAGLVLNNDGTVDVAAGTDPGVYSFEYRLCSVAHPAICETATATVNVSPDIEAAAESFTDVSQAGGTTPSILTSDTLNGDPADLTTVTITAPVPADITDANGDPATGVTLDPATGVITVAAGTDAGTYSVSYEICTIALPVTCDTAVETVTVLPSVVTPTDDSATIDSSAAVTGATGVVNLFDGDTINGDPADSTNATVQPVDPATVPSELTVNPDGTVDVAPGTAPGVYTFDYELCSTDTVPVCETATATVNVSPDIEAAAESFTDVSQAGGDTPSILTSDTLNGDPADLTTVTITAPVPADITDANGDPATGVTLDPATGVITVAAGTDAGTYSVSYEICTIALPVTCDTAVETVTVLPSVVTPTDDSATIDSSAAVTGATGVVNLFDGDTNNGDPADSTNATVQPVDPATVPSELTVNPDGTVDVAPGTAPGVYTFDYELCSTDTVPVCETATATVNVSPDIEAAAESFDTYGPTGGTTPSVLTSDTLNGDPADLTTVDITAPVPGDYKDASGQPVTGLTLDPATGLITIDPGMAPGDYTVDYEICTKAAPVTCSTVTETITIGVPKLTLTMTAGAPGTSGGSNPSATDPGDTIPYTLTVTNDGDVTMEDIDVTSQDLTNIVCNPTTLAPGEMATCTADPYVITVDDFNAGGIEKTASVTGTSTAGMAEDVSDTRNDGGSEGSDDPDLDGGSDGDPTNDPTIITLAPLPAAPGAVSVTKTANLSLVNYGDSVTYTLVYENTSALNIADLDLVDELPGGLAYTPGTAQLDGVATEPSVAGRQLTWEGVDIAAGASVEVTLTVRVLPDSATQELMNSAWAIQGGDVVSNIGTATIRIRPEHVFHCSDVIGKVFDDRNGNGIQDGPDSLAGLTDQTVTGGKFESAPAVENRGEPGLAGVRLVTVNGHLITTDAYGRFHVPCAALPADGGSNFTLKVDTRTLPSGYRMTTENPRVLRLTAGRFGRMNFGATIADVARIDLDATAFATDQNGRRVAIPALDQALRAMLNDPSNPVSVVHLRYHRADGETPRMARHHLDLVEDILNEAWTGQSGTRLLVERETLLLNQ